MSFQWNNWVPGVLSGRQVIELCKAGLIEDLDEKHVDASSLDLCPTKVAYELTEGTVKPLGSFFLEELPKISQGLLPDEGTGDVYTLQPKHSYVFKVGEQLNLPSREDLPLYGLATAKSSLGRVDVIVRLIVDGAREYDFFDPHTLAGGDRKMYIEVSPITFAVKVKVGEPLSQLRLFLGSPEDCLFNNRLVYRNCLRLPCDHEGSHLEDGSLSVDLSNVTILNDEACAFKAKTPINGPSLPPIPLWEGTDPKPNPSDYWEFCKAEGQPGRLRLRLEKDRFYLLRSRERLYLPEGIAVYARAMDEALGEMRIHYAGFVHPGFGMNRKDGKIGTPLMYEVRSHSLPVNLCHGEKLATLMFYRMSEGDVGDSGYNEQELAVSKFFGAFAANSPPKESDVVSSAS